MDNEKTETQAMLIQQVFSFPELTDNILLIHKSYCNFRLTCKYMYTAVNNGENSFRKKLQQANSLQPSEISNFFYNHPIVSDIFSTAIGAVAASMLEGPDVLFGAACGATIGAAFPLVGVACLELAVWTPIMILYSVKESIPRSTPKILSPLFTPLFNILDSLSPSLTYEIRIGSCIGSIAGVGYASTNGLGSAVAVAAATTIVSKVGLFANQHLVKNKLIQRAEIKQNISEELRFTTPPRACP